MPSGEDGERSVASRGPRGDGNVYVVKQSVEGTCHQRRAMPGMVKKCCVVSSLERARPAG